LAYILNIETSTPICSVALTENNTLLGIKKSEKDQDHALSLTLLIQELLGELAFNIKTLDAIAVSEGPGSYTGLRIGVSTAKGICYALNKPLIAINTLQAMALSISSNYQNEASNLFCPMIDARRMEVYCGLYDSKNKNIKPIEAMIIDNNSFNEYLNSSKIIFFGNGSEKCTPFLTHKNTNFITGVHPLASQMAEFSYTSFINKQFVNTAYFEPFYLKDFIATVPKNKIIGI